MAAPEHNNWLMIGEALLIIKTTLDPYVQQVVSHWHQMLLRRLPNRCLSPRNCRATGTLCPSCIAWRAELCNQHKGDVRKISWINTDCTKWAQPQGSWEVAKVFMAYLGPSASQVIDAQSTDISGLLNVLRFFPDEAFGNNPVLRPSYPSIKCVTDQARNPWAHSPKQEMTTLRRDKAIKCLKQLLKDPALAAVLGNRLNDLQKLENDGITNISLSELRCLTLLRNELSAGVAENKAGVAENKAGVAENKDGVAESKVGVAENKAGVAENKVGVAENKSGLAENKIGVAENKAGVAENKVFIEEVANTSNAQGLDIQQVQNRLEENNTRLAEMSEKVNSNTLGASLQTRLPDFQDKVFGRDACIDHFAELLQQKKTPCVVLFGGPGFGKTTVAINVAHKLNALKSKVCLFVRLREKRSIKDICRELLAQVGQHPKEQEMEELFQWARSLKEEVVFVLDNAEDALQEDIKDAFCDLLQTLRSNNSSFIQFLITSRERFSLSDMEVTCEEIKILNIEEGIKVMRSMYQVSNPSNSHEDLDTFTELAHLCGGIPLALIMIGSLLSYVDHIPSLIDELKSFPMETLEDTTLPHYHQSVCGAFECSFKRLEGSLQAKLVRLSVFKGPFTQQAAAKILDCQERPVLAGKELKKLTDKAFLSKLDPMRRYEMHSLVQKYLLHAKRQQYQNDFDTATNNFIDHYASVIIEGHKMFWSKDKFKDSVQMFRDDNLNIEIALEMCYQDAKRMTKLFPNVWSISMYLEMCISLEKLNQFLESCSTSASSENEKGTEMEAQCFLAYYECKKAGNSEKYKTHFSNAKKLFKEEENTLSQSQKWLYKHSYGMLLDQQGKLDEAYQVTKDAADIAEKNTDTTDLSLTLNQLGIIEKHRKNFPEAESCFKKSHDKRKEVLGENHILTVSKRLADLYLQLGQPNKALELYERGLDTYKSYPMNKEKQCIYLLKNMGACCFELEQMEKSFEHFHKAIDLAERRLKGDQMVEVLLYSELGNAYHTMKNKPKAREYAQKALQMADRLSILWGGKLLLMKDILKELGEDQD